MIIQNTRNRSVSISLKSGTALNIVANGEVSVKDSEITDKVRGLKFLSFVSPPKVKKEEVKNEVVADIVDDTDMAVQNENKGDI